MNQGKHIAACWLVAALLVGGSGCAATASATRLQKDAAPPQETAISAPDSTVGNTAAELRRLMDAHQLTELRTTYNGTYGASLLFHADSLNYYVTLFHDKEFWRVIRTSSNDNAEQVYRTFVQQTEQLSKIYLDTVRLQAGKRYTERMVEINEKRLAGLQQEADQQRQAAAQVTAALQQNKQEAVTLSSDLQSSNAQLDELNRRIEALQQAQVDPSLNLPAPPATAPTPVPQDGQQQ